MGKIRYLLMLEKQNKMLENKESRYAVTMWNDLIVIWKKDYGSWFNSFKAVTERSQLFNW